MNRNQVKRINEELFNTVFDEELSKLVKSACEKQISKFPTRNDDGDLICSSCREPIGYRQRYCSKCGQRLEEVFDD